MIVLVARGIYDTACNITNLKWIRVMADSSAMATTLVSRLQMRIDNQPLTAIEPFVIEPRKEESDLQIIEPQSTRLPEITTQIINVTPFELPVEILTRGIVFNR